MSKEIYGQIVPPRKAQSSEGPARDAAYWKAKSRALYTDPCPWPISLLLLLDALKSGQMEKRPMPYIREKLFGYLKDEALWRLHELRTEGSYFVKEAWVLLTQKVEEKEKLFSQEFRLKIAEKNPELTVWGVKKKVGDPFPNERK